MSHIYIYMQNSLLPPVVATHLASTIRSSIGSMIFSTESTRFNRRKQRRLQYISISHHLSTQPPQHTTPCNLLASPPKLTTHTPTTPSTQPIHPKPPHHGTIQTVHLISPLPLCTHSCYSSLEKERL
jgi:hypothetical protein